MEPGNAVGYLAVGASRGKSDTIDRSSQPSAAQPASRHAASAGSRRRAFADEHVRTAIRAKTVVETSVSE